MVILTSSRKRRSWLFPFMAQGRAAELRHLTLFVGATQRPQRFLVLVKSGGRFFQKAVSASFASSSEHAAECLVLGLHSRLDLFERNAQKLAAHQLFFLPVSAPFRSPPPGDSSRPA
jgi:hypothetical protein